MVRFKMTKLRSNKGIYLTEYAVLLGVLGVTLFAVFVPTKRGIQSGVRTVADHVGLQGDAEQTYSDRRGYLKSVDATVDIDQENTVTEAGGTISYDSGTTMYREQTTSSFMGRRDK